MTKYNVPQSLLEEHRDTKFIVDGAQVAELKRLFVELREHLVKLRKHPTVQKNAWQLSYRIEHIINGFRVFEGDEAHELDMGNDED